MTRGRLVMFGVAMTLLLLAAPAGATVHLFVCHNHPDGAAALPTYGLRLDDLLNSGTLALPEAKPPMTPTTANTIDLISVESAWMIDDAGAGIFTFSFDYVDITGSASVILEYDDVAGTIHIHGRVYGGKDVGGGWDATVRGWADIDFTYSDHLVVQDDCPGAAGDDVYVTDESNNNGGTITLDGWGGDQTFNFWGKKKNGDCAFIFDNDYDSKGKQPDRERPQYMAWYGLAETANRWCT